jgi:LacI family transcriptional regulator
MGRTIHAEINRVRFARAKQLVAESDLPLKQVSFQAGFRHVQYMTAIFRRRLGQTPKEYRTSSRGR